MSHPTPEPSDPCATLEDFLLMIKKLSSSPAFKDAEVLTSNFKQLEAKVKAQDESMLSSRNELYRTKQELERSHERLLRAHREETHKIVNDNNKLQADCARLEAEIAQGKERSDGLAQEAKDLLQHINKKEKHTQNLNDQIATLKQDETKLRSDLARMDQNLRTRAEELQKHEAKLREQEKLRTDLLEKHSALENKLKEQGLIIKQIYNLAPKSVKDDTGHVSQFMNRFWQASSKVATKCFETDIAAAVLEEEQSWKALKAQDAVTTDLPFPQSNTMAAKRIRTIALMAVLSDLLAEHIFTPSYLFFHDDELRNVLGHLATVEPEREKFLRRILKSTSKDKQAAVIKNRQESVMKQVSTHIQPLLEERVWESLKTTLSKLLAEATELWSQVQCMVSHFDTAVTFDENNQAQWRSISWTESMDSFIEKEISHKHLQTLDPCLVLFPRVFVVTDSVSQPVFPGIVLPRSETLAAKDELEKIRQSRLLMGRTSIGRSPRSRRMTLHELDSDRRSVVS